MSKRDASLIVPFKFPQIPAEELEPEVFGSMALLFAIFSLILKIKILSLFALFFSVHSMLNQKETEKQGLGSGISFSFVAFLINYIAPYLVPIQSS